MFLFLSLYVYVHMMGHQAAKHLLYPVSSILCILVSLHLHPFIPVSCMLHVVSVSGMLHVVSCILDSAIWMEECGPRITRITTHWPHYVDPGGSSKNYQKINAPRAPKTIPKVT